MKSKYAAIERLQTWESYAHDKDLRYVLGKTIKSMQGNMAIIEGLMQEYGIKGPDGDVYDVCNAINSQAIRDRFIAQSGRDTDKFAGVGYRLTQSGVPYLLDNSLSYLEARVIQSVDAGTHNIFIGELTGAEVLKDGQPMTYAFYQEVKRGVVPQTAPTYIQQKEENKTKMDKYVCKVCGYVYDPEQGDPDSGIAPGTPFEQIPDDWVCPVCGVGKSDFEKE